MTSNRIGRYEIIREIARSNDIVYEARDVNIGRRVALKELAIPANLTGQARRERVDRFLREAKAAGSLSSPHIVTIYEVGQEGERHFIAMEYLEGRSLREVLQMDGALSVERARSFTAQVCEALQYAHERGIIHRDIKPDNIQVLPNDVVKLTDFGIARIVTDPSLTADGQVFGTPSYMSPEQIAGKPLDARTDIFSLGVTLYEMLAGRKPFTGDSVVTITYNIMNQEPPPMPGVPPEMQQVALRAMVKAPEGRFQTAGEMRNALLGARTVTGRMPDANYAAPTIMPGRGDALFTPAAQAPAAGQPEATQYEAPPLFIPRRPSLLGEFFKQYGHFIWMLFVAIVLSLGCVLFVWVASKAYQNYQDSAQEANAAQYVQRGVSLFNNKHYQEAVDEFKRAIAAAPRSNVARTASSNAAAAYTNQGNDFLNSGQPGQALQSYAAALRFDPRSATAHYGLGMAYHSLNQSGAAARQWQWVLDNAPYDSVAKDARHNLAITYYNQGLEAYNARQFDEAANYWDQCVMIDPGSAAAQQADTARQRLLSNNLGFSAP